MITTRGGSIIARDPEHPELTRKLHSRLRVTTSCLLGIVALADAIYAIFLFINPSFTPREFPIIALSLAALTAVAALLVFKSRARGFTFVLIVALTVVHGLRLLLLARLSDAPAIAASGVISIPALTIFVLALIFTLWPRPRPVLSSDVKLEDWQSRLIGSLRDAGIEQPTDRFHRSILGFAIFGLFAVICGLLGSQITPDRILLFLTTQLGWWPVLTESSVRWAFWAVILPLYAVWLAIFILGFLRLRNLLHRRARRLAANSAEDELFRSKGRRPVLYLRSFGLDAPSQKPSLLEILTGAWGLSTPEEVVTQECSRVGPVIAIGRPGEHLPPLGAARFYVSDDKWQQKVADVVREASLVVWATGTSPGLQWELSHLVRNYPAEKLILWCHPHVLKLNETQREEEWTRFRDTLGGIFLKPLPERLDDIRFIHFTADFEPLEARSSRSFNNQRFAIMDVLDRKGLLT